MYGYRITGAPRRTSVRNVDELGGYAERLRAALPPFYSPLTVLPQTPSTMAVAAGLADAGAPEGAPEGATVVTEEQTAGRGRLGRTWVAPPGSSLLVSVVLRPPLPVRSVWLVAALAGVSLAEAVRAVAGADLPVGLKWPNDLLIGGRKTAGLLAEARMRSERLVCVVLGMGVNVNQGVAEGAAGWAPEVATRATSVALAAGHPVDRAALLGAWAERFLAGYRQLAEGASGPVLAAYRDWLETIGQPVRATRLDAAPVDGTAVDLTQDGSLVVLTSSGRRVEVSAADVEHLRPGSSVA
jgi:BirA family biotin operon repressor/biotin-[acetyl-CoA-carboxylase] ligase